MANVIHAKGSYAAYQVQVLGNKNEDAQLAASYSLGAKTLTTGEYNDKKSEIIFIVTEPGVLNAVKNVDGVVSGYAIEAANDSKVGNIYHNGELIGKDKLESAVTFGAAVGKVPSGAQFAKGTSTEDVIKAIASFAQPVITVGLYNGDTKVSGNMLCSGTDLSLTPKHSETNTGSIATLKYSLNGATAVNLTASGTTADIASAQTVNIASRGSYSVSVTGTNTLGSAISASASIQFFMPMFAYVAANEASIVSGLADATAHSTAQPTEKEMTADFPAGSYYCFALPASLDLVSMGTKSDYGFDQQARKGSSRIVVKSGSRAYNGSNSADYTIYAIRMDEPWNNFTVRGVFEKVNN